MWRHIGRLSWCHVSQNHLWNHSGSKSNWFEKMKEKKNPIFRIRVETQTPQKVEGGQMDFFHLEIGCDLDRHEYGPPWTCTKR